MTEGSEVVPIERIEGRILFLRKQKVLLDTDLAALYEVPVKRLNEQVKRNAGRFPPDFAFQLTGKEHEALRSQNATLKKGRGEHRKYLPWAFTEHGALMAASVLNSPRAVEMSIMVVRAFVRLRRMISTHADLARKIEEMENQYDAQFKVVFDAIREIIVRVDDKERAPRRRIGFHGSKR